MDKPILIGIHGVKRAGKDTTAQFVQDWAARQVPALSTCRREFRKEIPFEHNAALAKAFA